jgi:hypothetical protein
VTITEEEEGWKQVERLLTTLINLAEVERITNYILQSFLRS